MPGASPGLAVLARLFPVALPSQAVLAGTLVSGHGTHSSAALHEAGSLRNLGVLADTCLDVFAFVFVNTRIQICKSPLLVPVIAHLPDDCITCPQSSQDAVLLPSHAAAGGRRQAAARGEWGEGWRPEGARSAPTGLVPPAHRTTQPEGHPARRPGINTDAKPWAAAFPLQRLAALPSAGDSGHQTVTQPLGWASALQPVLWTPLERKQHQSPRSPRGDTHLCCGLRRSGSPAPSSLF